MTKEELIQAQSQAIDEGDDERLDEIRAELMQLRLRQILDDEGYDADHDVIMKTYQDPHLDGVYAVRACAPIDRDWDGMDFLIHLDDEPGDQVEEVEFKTWPPESVYTV
jgi:hypothetical protein